MVKETFIQLNQWVNQAGRKKRRIGRIFKLWTKTFCLVVLWPTIALWQLEVPKLELEILNLKGGNNHLDLVNAFHIDVEEKYYDHIQIFTYGSKDPETDASGAAFIFKGCKIEAYKRTSDYPSVFTVELHAILMGV